jgi:hypothetical protein
VNNMQNSGRRDELATVVSAFCGRTQ